MCCPGSGVSVEFEGAAVVSSVVAASCGDIGVAFLSECAGYEVADGGEGVGLVPGPGLLRIFPECDITDIMLAVLKMSSRLRLWDVVRELLGEAWVNAGLSAARFLEPVVQLAGLRGRGEDYPAVRGPGLLAARDVSLA